MLIIVHIQDLQIAVENNYGEVMTETLELLAKLWERVNLFK